MAADSSADLPADATATTAPTAPTAPEPAQPPSSDQQGLLPAKAEPKPDTPIVVDKAVLGPDSFIEKFSDETIYVTNAGSRETISELWYETFRRQNPKAGSLFYSLNCFSLPTQVDIDSCPFSSAHPTAPWIPTLPPSQRSTFTHGSIYVISGDRNSPVPGML